jgi:molybdopterin-guanine dinucleotide biosynthesis protein A
MGQDKAKLRLGGKSLLSHARAAALLAGFQVRIIRRDLVPSCGPLGGVYTGLRRTRSDIVLFLSCDMPFVSAGLIERLSDKLRPATKAVFLVGERPGFPFVLHRSVLAVVEDLLQEREYSIQTLAGRLKSAYLRLPRSESYATLNVNTPEEFAVAKALWQSDTGPFGKTRYVPANRTLG